MPATKTAPAEKAPAEKAPEAPQDATQTPTDTPKPAEDTPKVERASAKKLFTADAEVVALDELPDNPEGRSAGGFTAQWKNDIERLINTVPEGKWVPIKEYSNAQGARMVQRNMDPFKLDEKGNHVKVERTNPRTGEKGMFDAKVDPEDGQNNVGPEFLAEIKCDTGGKTIRTAVRRADVDGKRVSRIYMKWTS